MGSGKKKKKNPCNETKALEQHMALFNCQFRNTSVCLCVCVCPYYYTWGKKALNSEQWTLNGQSFYERPEDSFDMSS